MITRFEVDGFKSLRDFAVDLEPLTVFVGPNGAGKSNLLEAMALLGRLSAMSVEEAFKQGRGRILDQFSRFGGETSRTIRFAVELSLRTPVADFEEGAPPLPTRYRYELCIERRARDSGIEELVVADESLRVKPEGEDAAEDVFVLRQGREFKRERQAAVLALYGVEEGHRIPRTHTGLAGMSEGIGSLAVSLSPEDIAILDQFKREGGFRSRQATLAALIAGFASTLSDPPELGPPSRGWKAVIGGITEELAAFQLVHLDAARLRENSEKISSGILAPDASNLAAVLADLPAPVLGAIRADLVSLVPGLAGFEVVPDGDSLRLDFKLAGGELLPARLASDGTLRALALLTVLTIEPHPSVLGIEEPENGIYPGRLRRLLSILREISVSEGKTQLLLTTHSPVVVAAFRDRPEWLRMVDVVVRDGKRETRVRPVGKPKKPSDGAFLASLREVDALLHAADPEAAE